MLEKKRIITLGFFDGIHRGHAALLSRTLELSLERTLTPSIITFDAPPLEVISGIQTPMINSAEDRAGLVGRIFGINDILFLHFDKSMAAMQWDEFIGRIKREFNAAHLVAGYDFRFGNNGAGNATLLTEKCNELGMRCDIIPEISHKGITCSSTYVRTLLMTGLLESANDFLGHPHVLTDVVHDGYRFGRTLGTPTINMCFQDGVLVPAFGVYATKAFLEDGSEHIAVTNIGVKPTVGGSKKVTAETHILDFQGNLYGSRVRVEFHKYLRAERKFDNTERLKDQIQNDCEASRLHFKKLSK